MLKSSLGGLEGRRFLPHASPDEDDDTDQSEDGEREREEERRIAGTGGVRQFGVIGA